MPDDAKPKRITKQADNAKDRYHDKHPQKPPEHVIAPRFGLAAFREAKEKFYETKDKHEKPKRKHHEYRRIDDELYKLVYDRLCRLHFIVSEPLLALLLLYSVVTN